MKHILASLVLLAGILIGGVPALADSTSAYESDGITAFSNRAPRPDPETQAMNLINQRRASLGLSTLSTSSALVSAARRHSTDMGEHNACGHTGTDGSTYWSRMIDAGYTGTPWSEVIACGYDSPTTAVDALWNSPGHYAVLTSVDINDIGCGWWSTRYGRRTVVGWLTCDVGVSPR